MPDATDAIVADRLVKIYKSGTAVAGVSFALPVGSITGLLGGKGAGYLVRKTSLRGKASKHAGSSEKLVARMSVGLPAIHCDRSMV